MILKIEQWVSQTHPFDADSINLFNESTQCYKIGAYRSAFLMSYLAFMTAIRIKVLNVGIKPENITEESWIGIKAALENPNKWEERVTNILLTSPPNNSQEKENNVIDTRIFKLKNHQTFVDSFKSWRHMRNNCAHAKEIMMVDASTVECFWNFIKDNIFDLQISSGVSYWSEVIFKSFRDQHEELATTCYQYIDALSTSHISKEELHEIYESINRNISQLLFVDISDKQKFWLYIYRNTMLQDSFIPYLKSDLFNLADFYIILPNVLKDLLVFEDAISFRRDTFIPWLKEHFEDYNIKTVFWDMVLDICDSFKSEDDKKRFLHNIPYEALENTPTEKQIEQLIKLGYFDLKKSSISLTYSYDDVGKQQRYISATVLVLNNIEYDYNIVCSLNKYVADLASHGYPWTQALYNNLKKHLSEEAKEKIRVIAKDNFKGKEIELNDFLKLEVN